MGSLLKDVDNFQIDVEEGAEKEIIEVQEDAPMWSSTTRPEINTMFKLNTPIEVKILNGLKFLYDGKGSITC